MSIVVLIIEEIFNVKKIFPFLINNNICEKTISKEYKQYIISYMITRQQFDEAKGFIYSDIQREIDHARNGNASGNFLCALALLCYTEFAGGLMPGAGTGSRANFNAFYDTFGYKYKVFGNKYNVYRIFRCGLAHEYFVKKDCTVYMLISGNEIGLGRGRDRRFYFIVEKYFEDFKKAFEKLEKSLF